MTWHCAICGRKLRKPALLIRDGLAIGPKCAAQRGLSITKAAKVLRFTAKLKPAHEQMELFGEVAP